jgi:type VI secretion system FHA domain protein
MMKVRIVGFQGKHLSDGVCAEFGSKGGTLGRAPDTTLTLADPERHVSRIHATVACEAGDFIITDLGTVNPLRINGQPLGQGNRARLADGDELAIGDYLLAVSIEEPALAATKSAPILDVFAAPPISSSDGWGPPGVSAPAGKAPASASIIPEDFDPFAERGPMTPPAASQDEGLQLGPVPGAVGPSIDDLFGLSGSSAQPFAPGGPLSEPTPPSGRGAGMMAQPDQTPEIHSAFQAPRARSPETPAPAPETAARSEGQAFYVSWEGQGAPAAARSVVEAAQPADRKADTPPPVATPPRPAASRQAPAESVTPAARDELTQAFLEGLGLPGLPFPQGVTPELMRNLGHLLREATQGTLDLLLARAMTKREIRADATLILGKENNPLKFSPTVEVALTHLLTPTAVGFMGPHEAMRDAYADLRAHQFGFMAGMRAALAGVLARFDPGNLERRLTQKSMLDNMLPMNRRAKLWDSYTSLFGEISQEVEEDFHALFGREFLRAYEEQVERLRTKSDT